MKITNLVRFFIIALVTAAAALSPSAKAQTNSNPLHVSLSGVTNGAYYIGPANIGLNVHTVDSNFVQTISYFSGVNLLTTITNTGATNAFFYYWTNIGFGSYTLTAVGTDSVGNVATSAPVTITVIPPVPQVTIYSPTNNQKLTWPTNVNIYARAVESLGAIQGVEFFAGTNNLGYVTTTGIYSNISTQPLYELTWSNAPLGYASLTAVAIDTNGAMATSGVVTINIATNTPPPPVPFVVDWYYPTNGQVFNAPANVGVHASVTDSNVVRTMQYFVNSSPLATVTNTGNVPFTNTATGNPFFYGWSNVTAGTYVLTAVATDVTGATATSGPVTITVQSPPPPSPIAYIYSPTNNSQFTIPANISIYARAVETNGAIISVEFFTGTNSLGIATNAAVYTNISTAPLYKLTWSNAPLGNFALTAVATDSSGQTATSAVANIKVVTNTPIPFVVGWFYPTNGETYYYVPNLFPANVALYASVADSNVVHTMQYFANSALIATVTNTGNVLTTNLANSNPFFFSWPNVPAGTYTMTAVATDVAGARATSGPVTITVRPRPPTVNIYSLTNGSAFLNPTNVVINVAAAETNSTIQQIELLAGSTVLGIVTNSSVASNANSQPFYAQFSWPNPPPGNYPLTAIATDSQGNLGTSSVVNINILANPPPVPFAVSWYYPTNGQKYTVPTDVGMYAWVTDSNTASTVQFFANSMPIATFPNTNGILYTNYTPFHYIWTNVPAGNYTLTVVVTEVNGMTATSAPVSITVQLPPPPQPVAYIYSPTNNSLFTMHDNISIYARALETGGAIASVEFFAGSNSLGSASTTAIYSNISTAPLYKLTWSNAPAGNFALTAVATDTNGVMATSQVVNINVQTNPPVPFVVGWEYPTPTNGQTYALGITIGMHAWVTDSNTVSTVQYFANSLLIGTITNSRGVLLTNTGSDPLNLFGYGWPQVGQPHPPAGTYVLTAVATDVTGATATSAPVTFQVLNITTLPPIVRITSPPDAASFRSPVNIPIYAYAIDTDGYLKGVEFFAGTTDLGPGKLVPRGTNAASTNYYGLYYYTIWSNAPVGTWALTAQATDNSNAVTVSSPVNITVLPPVTTTTNIVPIALISAIDPVAIEGTNCWTWPGLSNAVPNWSNWIGGTVVPFTNCGPKNATFRVYHTGETNSELTINYSISGTASNGVDYVALPGTVTIPAGQRTAMISIVPIDDGPPDTNKTVIIRLTPSTTVPLSYYTYGTKAAAEAVILDGPQSSPAPTATGTVLPDQTFHLNASGPNGAWFRIEASPDMSVWTPICTNQVVNGSIDFADPNAANSASQFYRAVPEANPPQ